MNATTTGMITSSAEHPPRTNQLVLEREEVRRLSGVYFSQHKVRLISFAVKICKNSFNGEDVVSDVFLDLIDKKIPLPAEEPQVIKVLYTATYKRALYKKSKRSFFDKLRSFDPEQNEHIQDDSQIDIEYEYQELTRLYKIASDNLTGIEQKVFKLHTLDLCTYREISEKMGITLDAVKYNLTKAKGKVISDILKEYTIAPMR